MQGISARRTARPTRRTRLLATTALAAGLALGAAGCAAGGHNMGDTVTTKLNGSSFDGHLAIRATKVERVTSAAMDQFALSPKGDDAYLAHFTVRTESGTFPKSAVSALANDAWGLQAADKLQAGPELDADDRNPTLQQACPFDRDAIAKALRTGGTADVCAVLLAPADSTVNAVSYMRAAPVDEGPEGDATITWRAATD